MMFLHMYLFPLADPMLTLCCHPHCQLHCRFAQMAFSSYVELPCGAWKTTSTASFWQWVVVWWPSTMRKSLKYKTNTRLSCVTSCGTGELGIYIFIATVTGFIGIQFYSTLCFISFPYASTHNNRQNCNPEGYSEHFWFRGSVPSRGEGYCWSTASTEQPVLIPYPCWWHKFRNQNRGDHGLILQCCRPHHCSQRNHLSVRNHSAVIKQKLCGKW